MRVHRINLAQKHQRHAPNHEFHFAKHEILFLSSHLTKDRLEGHSCNSYPPLMDLTEPLSLNWRSAILATISVSTLVCSILCLISPFERRAAIHLVAFAMAATITSVPLIIGFAGAYKAYPELTFLPTQMTLLFGPFFYLHAHTLMLGKAPRWAYWLLAPGALHLAYQTALFLLLTDGEAKLSFSREFNYPYVLPVAFFLGASFAIWALLKVWLIRRSYIDWLVNSRSDGDRFDPSWLRDYIVLSVPLFAVWIAENIAGRYFQFSKVDRFWADAFSLFLIFVMTARAVQGLQLQFPKMQRDTQSEASPSDGPRDWALEGARLEALMAENHWYLDPEFSLTDLAQVAAMNENYVSRAINIGLARNFNDFINGYRVETAKSLLLENDKSISELAFKSGFASKSSFNRSFKKVVGLSPSEFRRNSA